MTTADTLRAEGRAATLIEQLTAKFGPVPERAREIVTDASLEQLKAWARHVLTATTLEDVLGAPNSESRRDEFWTNGYTMMREAGWSSDYARHWADGYATQRIEGRGKHDAMVFADGYAEGRTQALVDILKPLTARSGPDPGAARSLTPAGRGRGGDEPKSSTAGRQHSRPGTLSRRRTSSTASPPPRPARRRGELPASDPTSTATAADRPRAWLYRVLALRLRYRLERVRPGRE